MRLFDGWAASATKGHALAYRWDRDRPAKNLACHVRSGFYAGLRKRRWARFYRENAICDAILAVLQSLDSYGLSIFLTAEWVIRNEVARHGYAHAREIVRHRSLKIYPVTGKIDRS